MRERRTDEGGGESVTAGSSGGVGGGGGGRNSSLSLSSSFRVKSLREEVSSAAWASSLAHSPTLSLSLISGISKHRVETIYPIGASVKSRALLYVYFGCCACFRVQPHRPCRLDILALKKAHRDHDDHERDLQAAKRGHDQGGD